MNMSAGSKLSTPASPKPRLKRWAAFYGRATQPSNVGARQQRQRARAVAPAAPPAPSNGTIVPAPLPRPSEQQILSDRHAMVASCFPSALGVDDFMSRVEIALCGYGFTGDNSIAMTNLCRDEVTAILKDKIETVFGSSFNTNGLGAILTCGVTGIGAGLSHSPICSNDGRERYVFFSFPHIAINPNGEMGGISRPGRPGISCACGALSKVLKELKQEGLSKSCKVPGVHDPLDPEYTILKQRLARRVRYEELNVDSLTLADITAVAERTITDDLEYLIEKCVDPKKADYAVVAGVQIHNWGMQFEDHTEPSMEFVAPTKVYVSVNGEKTFLDLTQIPSLTPRQIALLAQVSMMQHASPQYEGLSGVSTTDSISSTLHQIPYNYLAKRMGAGGASWQKSQANLLSTNGNGKANGAHNGNGHAAPAARLASPSAQPKKQPKKPKQAEEDKQTEASAAGPSCEWPAWQSLLRVSNQQRLERDAAAPTMESVSDDDAQGPDDLVEAEQALEQAQLLLRSAVKKVSGVKEPAPPVRTSFTNKGAVN